MSSLISLALLAEWGSHFFIFMDYFFISFLMFDLCDLTKEIDLYRERVKILPNFKISSFITKLLNFSWDYKRRKRIMTVLFIIRLKYQSIFCISGELNFRSLIQLLEILLVELVKTYSVDGIDCIKFVISNFLGSTCGVGVSFFHFYGLFFLFLFDVWFMWFDQRNWSLSWKSENFTKF